MRSHSCEAHPLLCLQSERDAVWERLQAEFEKAAGVKANESLSVVGEVRPREVQGIEQDSQGWVHSYAIRVRFFVFRVLLVREGCVLKFVGT